MVGWRKKLLKLGFGLFLMILIICLVWLLRIINSPATGKGVTVTASTPTVQPANVNKFVTLTGKYFRFSYPVELTPRSIAPPQPPFVENYLLVKSQLQSSWKLAVQIESLPSGNLNDDGSYHLRKVKSDIYTEKVLTIGTMSVHEMTDTTAGGFSTAAFFTHAGLMAIVSLTGDDSGEINALQATLTTVLSTWQWS